MGGGSSLFNFRSKFPNPILRRLVTFLRRLIFFRISRQISEPKIPEARHFQNFSQISEPNFAEARHFSPRAPIFRTQFSAAPQAPHAPLLPAPPPATATFFHFSSSRKNYFFSRAPRLFSYRTLLSRYRCAEPPRRAATTPLSLSFGYVRYHLPFTIFLLPQSFYTLHIPTCAQKFRLHTHTLH